MTVPPLINKQIVYLTWKSTWYSHVLDWYANNVNDIHTYLIDKQLLLLLFIRPWLLRNDLTIVQIILF
jgi:hypothetical protein